MTTSQKLWLGFGFLTLLVVASTVVTLVQVRSIQKSVERQATLTQPFLLSTRELEVSSSRFVLNVRSLLQTENPVMRVEVVEAEERVERAMAEYDQLVATPYQKELSAGFAIRWKELRDFAHELLGNVPGPLRQKDSDRLAELRLALENYLSGEMQAEALIGYETQRNETLANLRTILTMAMVLLLSGVLFSMIIGGAVGRAVLRSERELLEAHDMLEEKVAERTAELHATADSLARSNRELEQFASVASHDLQEPLRKIQAFGDRLQDRCRDELGDQGKEYLDRILASAARMRRLIDDLLSFSRVASKAQPFVLNDLTVVMHEVVTDLEGRLQQVNGQVEIGELPSLDGDPMQLQQLFQNLIANGLKFHRSDVTPLVRVQGRMLKKSKAVDLDHAAPVRMCEITVEDNGIGFEEVYLDRIFNVFQRLHGRNEFEGTGMGLAICRKIVERHGGSITARSIPGEGSTFIVTLPVEQPQNEPNK